MKVTAGLLASVGLAVGGGFLSGFVKAGMDKAWYDRQE